MNRRTTGGCLCGAVRYEIEGPLPPASACQTSSTLADVAAGRVALTSLTVALRVPNRKRRRFWLLILPQKVLDWPQATLSLVASAGASVGMIVAVQFTELTFRGAVGHLFAFVSLPLVVILLTEALLQFPCAPCRLCGVLLTSDRYVNAWLYFWGLVFLIALLGFFAAPQGAWL